MRNLSALLFILCALAFPCAAGAEITLHQAASDGAIEDMELLAKQDAPLEAIDDDGRTALHTAVDSGQVEAARWLLTHGAKVDAPDAGDMTPLHIAVWHTDVGMARLLLKQGAPLEAKDAQGHTPLWLAAYISNRDMVELLLRAGADIHTTDIDGRGVLHGRAQMGKRYAHQEEITIRLLVKHGADPDAADPLGRTPLMSAVLDGSAARVKLLLSLGAKTDIKDEEGDTALDYAESAEQPDIAALLQAQDAAPSESGTSPPEDSVASPPEDSGSALRPQ